jgi:hypothetical protein
MRGRRDRDGVDAVAHERFGIWEGGAPERAGYLLATLAIRIGDADQLHAGQFRQHAGMIATHDADAHHADAQNTVPAFFNLTHLPKSPLRYSEPTPLIP